MKKKNLYVPTVYFHVLTEFSAQHIFYSRKPMNRRAAAAVNQSPRTIIQVRIQIQIKLHFSSAKKVQLLWWLLVLSFVDTNVTILLWIFLDFLAASWYLKVQLCDQIFISYTATYHYLQAVYNWTLSVNGSSMH